MANASKVALHFDYKKLPFLSGARGYAEKGIFPGGAFDNKKHFGEAVRFDGKIDEPSQMLTFDPQTSGGLLLGVPAEKLADFQSRAQELGQAAWAIGEVRAGKGIQVA
jgi:selenide,water dikinase